MFVIVLTGGLGAGKSTAAEFFRSRGASVISLDDVAHHALTPGTPTFERVVAEFGQGVLAVDGSIDRKALADAAFETSQGVARLNSIVHPEVAREVGTSLMELRLMPEHRPEVVVLEVPLLAEAPVFAELADEVVAVAAAESQRLERAVDCGMSLEDATRRIAYQASDAERASMADVVIRNDGDLDRFRSALDAYWEEHVVGGGAVGR